MYILYDPNNNKIFFSNITLFAKENNLDRIALSKVLSGKQGSHKGYTKEIKDDALNTRRISGELYDPNGNLHKFSGVRTLCRKFNLDQSGVKKLLNKTCKNHRGWSYSLEFCGYRGSYAKINYIYVMHVPGYYKVGVSANPYLRKKFIETSNPHEVAIVRLYKSNIAFEVEKELHNLLAQYHHKLEWFTIFDLLIVDTFMSENYSVCFEEI